MKEEHKQHKADHQNNEDVVGCMGGWVSIEKEWTLTCVDAGAGLAMTLKIRLDPKP